MSHVFHSYKGHQEMALLPSIFILRINNVRGLLPYAARFQKKFNGLSPFGYREKAAA
jgi:hypothetical protein